MKEIKLSKKAQGVIEGITLLDSLSGLLRKEIKRLSAKERILVGSFTVTIYSPAANIDRQGVVGSVVVLKGMAKELAAYIEEDSE